MPYTVLSFTRDDTPVGQVMPHRLSERLMDRLWDLIETHRPIMETCKVEIYFLDISMNKDSFDELKGRFGVNPMQFQFLKRVCRPGLRTRQHADQSRWNRRSAS